MEIVELAPADVPPLAAALGQLLLDAHASNMALGLAPPLTPAKAEAAYLDTGARLAPGDRLLWAAHDGQRVVGTIQLVRGSADNGRHRAEIVRLAVAADERGRGLGRRLLEVAVERARELGLRVLWLTTHAETDADGFYERCGWTRMGVMPAYSQRPDGTLAASVFYHLEP
ncbi:MAG: GNAT family N-acetyltransferase [Gaiellaceae bacterium]